MNALLRRINITLRSRVAATRFLIRGTPARYLPTLGVNTHLDETYRLLLAGSTGVLATHQDQVIDIVTCIDLIHYWDCMRQK